MNTKLSPEITKHAQTHMVRLQVITISDFAENNITMQCSELSNNMLQELIMSNKGMARFYLKHRTRVPY